MTFDSRPPVKYLITKGDATPENFPVKKSEIVGIVRRSAEIGIDLVQIREKNLTAKLFFELANAAVDAAAESETKILVNDRFDIAIAAKADGVHLTGSSLKADLVRKCAPEEFIIGVSTHTLEETIQAKLNSADFALFGPVFETPCKGEPSGLGKLRQVCEAVSPFPVIAVGGVDRTNSLYVSEAGAAGIAAIRYLNEFVNID